MNNIRSNEIFTVGIDDTAAVADDITIRHHVPHNVVVACVRRFFSAVGLDVDKDVVVEITIRHHVVRTAVIVHVRRAKPPIFFDLFGNFYPKVYHNTSVGIIYVLIE